MARPRKRHVQQELFRHGGKRKGAGRPPKGRRSSERHQARPALRASEPVHVVLRATEDVGTLRRRQVYHAIRKALVATFTRDDFRVVHLSIQRNHVHLLGEANDRMALARGMQAFQISAAKHINATLTRKGKRRRGTVFPDRYHCEIIKSRRRARNALAYVLNNWRKHREPLVREYTIDPFSTAVRFDGWRDLHETGFPASYEPLPVWEPKTWLLREGWRLYGLVATTERPGGKAALAE
jgi:REP element-mobilizing transposase RayT